MSVGGSVSWIFGSASLIPWTIASVEVAPFLRIVISTERLPSTWTTLVCGAEPSRTWATSLIVMVAPFTTLTCSTVSVAFACIEVT